jgi:cysteine desulfurase/selenocysteine lyase
MRRLWCWNLVALSLILTGAASAEPFDDAVAAYKRKDYASALILFRSLAEKGNPKAQGDQGAGTWCPDDSFRLWEDARRFEAWEFSAAGRLGLRASLQELNRVGLANVRAHNIEKLRCLVANLHDMHGLTVFEGEASDAAFLTFRHAVLSVDTIVDELASRGIAIGSVGRNYARWELETRGLEKIARVAPHIYSTDDDIGRFTEELIALSKQAKQDGGNSA